VAEEARYDILFDGACPLCQWSRARVTRFDAAGRLRFLDYNDPGVSTDAPFTREELAQEMHVRAPDGAWSAGFAAWATVLRALPALAWLGWLLGAPPFRWAGPRLYRWVARNRYLWPGAPPRCEAGVCVRHTGRS